MGKQNREDFNFVEDYREWTRVNSKYPVFLWKYAKIQTTKSDACQYLIVGLIFLIISLLIFRYLYDPGLGWLSYFLPVVLFILAVLQILGGLLHLRNLKVKQKSDRDGDNS